MIIIVLEIHSQSCCTFDAFHLDWAYEVFNRELVSPIPFSIGTCHRLESWYEGRRKKIRDERATAIRPARQSDVAMLNRSRVHFLN